MRLTMLLLALLVLSPLVHAQNTPAAKQVTGTVTDTEKQPLPSAQLILKNGKKIIGFGMTDANGSFTVDLPATVDDSTSLEVRYFGYTTKVIPAAAWEKGTPLIITLRAENVELREVVVSADALPQLIKDDTISFRTEAYRDGTEDKIEDVIAKLPGVEVSEAGDITVNGKALDRILLDGEDVFDRSYKTLSQNVPADYVEQINVLSNYQPDQLTGNLNGTGETVMDLRLDPARKSLAFGNILLTGGTEDYRHAETNLFLLRRKTKLVNFGRYTTTGESASPGSLLQQRTTGLPGSIGTVNTPLLTSPATRQQRLVPVRDYLRNAGLGTAQSLLLTPTSHLRNRLIINVGRDTSTLRENRSRELITDLSSREFRLDGKYQLDRLSLWLKNDFNLLLGKQTRLDVAATVIKQRTFAGVDVLSTDLTEGTSEATGTDLESRPLTFNVDVRLVRRLNGKMALTLSSEFSRETLAQFQEYRGSVYNALLQDDALAFGQTLDRTFSGRAAKAVILQRAGKHRFRYVLGHRSGRTETLAQLSPIGTNRPSPDEITYQQQATFAEAAWNYAPRKWTFNAMARGNHFRLPFRIGVVSESLAWQHKLAPEISLNLKRQLTRRSTLTGGVSQTVRPIAADQAIPTTYLSEQTSLSAGLDSTFLLQAVATDLNYQYNNTFRQYGYGVRLNHTLQPNAVFQQLIAEDFLFVNRLVPDGRSAMSSVSANVYGNLPKTSTKLSARVTLFRFSNQVSFTGAPVNTVNNSLAAEVTANAPVGRKVKFSSQAKWQYFATNLAGERGQQQQLFLRQHLVWAITSSLRAVTKYRTFLPGLGTGQEVVHLFDQAIHYQPKDKAWSVSGHAINLFNQESVTERSIDPYLRTTRSYQLRPRTIYLQVNFDF